MTLAIIQNNNYKEDTNMKGEPKFNVSTQRWEVTFWNGTTMTYPSSMTYKEVCETATEQWKEERS